jgi:hypothetical protein
MLLIEMILGFTHLDTCPLWLSFKDDMPDESHVNIYNTWLWLTEEEIDTFGYLPDPKKPKTAAPLSHGYRVHIKRFTVMYYELSQDPSWDDLDIFNLTYNQCVNFSSRYIAGKVSLLQELPILKTP